MFFIGIISLFFLSACTCEEGDFPILLETPDVLRVEVGTCVSFFGPNFCNNEPIDEGDLVFLFSDLVEISTVKVGSTVLVGGENINFEGDAKVFGSPIIIDDIPSASFFYIEECELACTESSCIAEVILVGNDSLGFSIETPKGQALDGDNNGTDGGNFEKNVEISACFANVPRVTFPTGGVVYTLNDDVFFLDGGFWGTDIFFSHPMDIESVENNLTVEGPELGITDIPVVFEWNDVRDRVSVFYQIVFDNDSIYNFCDTSGEFNECEISLRIKVGAENELGFHLNEEYLVEFHFF